MRNLLRLDQSAGVHFAQGEINVKGEVFDSLVQRFDLLLNLQRVQQLRLRIAFYSITNRLQFCCINLAVFANSLTEQGFNLGIQKTLLVVHRSGFTRNLSRQMTKEVTLQPDAALTLDSFSDSHDDSTNFN